MNDRNTENALIKACQKFEIKYNFLKYSQKDCHLAKLTNDLQKKDLDSINFKEDDLLVKIVVALIIVPVSKATFYRLIKKDPLLKQIKIGGSSFWSKKNLLQFVENCKGDKNV